MAATTGAGLVTDDTRWELHPGPEKHDAVIDIAGNQTPPGTRAGTDSERSAGGGRRPEQGPLGRAVGAPDQDGRAGTSGKPDDGLIPCSAEQG